jgi:ubiquinone/menaquinone biosynthesis C-methylase UbiE
MLTRVLESEVMSGADEAIEYDAMDFSATDRLFAERAAQLAQSAANVNWVVDLGAGNARIPLAMCAVLPPAVRVCAVEMSGHMLALAARHRTNAGISRRRFHLLAGDAKHTPFAPGSVSMVTSNSLIHHIADPRAVFRETARIVREHAPIVIRDLVRPESEEDLARLVSTYAGGSSSLQRTLFADSLRAALSVREVREALDASGLQDVRVSQITDRHWTAERG